MSDPLHVMFVCMGNICRSPAAHGIMQKLVNDAGLSDRILVTSSATGGWHVGNPPDSRMRAAAQRRGYELNSKASQVNLLRIKEAHIVLVMDADNHHHLLALQPSEEEKAKIHFMRDFCSDRTSRDVPDPYYGGDAGFEHVLDLLEDGCQNLLQHLLEQPLQKQ